MEVLVKLLNPEGMHARPAGVIVKTANQFQSQVQMEVGGKVKNAKSLINILSFNLKYNDAIQLKADGPDADAALAALTDLFSKSIVV